MFFHYRIVFEAICILDKLDGMVVAEEGLEPPTRGL
jgi:hypothetical protein